MDRSLQLSDEDVQAAYHAWTYKIPAVKWHSVHSLCVKLLMCFAIAVKATQHDACTWKHLGFGLPTVLLLAAQVALAHCKAPMRAQSLAGLAGALVLKAAGTAGIACRDPCLLSIAGAHQALPVLCFGAILHTLFAHIVFRVDMQHIGVFSTGIFVLHTAAMYLRYLAHTGGSDPFLWGLSVVALSQAVATQGAIVARYHVAKLNMTSFMKLARRREGRLRAPSRSHIHAS